MNLISFSHLCWKISCQRNWQPHCFFFFDCHFVCYELVGRLLVGIGEHTNLSNRFHHVCAHTWLCPRLCPEMFVPRDVCAQTWLCPRLCPDMFVPRDVCAQTWLWPHDYNMSMQKCVWAHVWAQSCGLKHVWAQTRCLPINHKSIKCFSSELLDKSLQD